MEHAMPQTLLRHNAGTLAPGSPGFSPQQDAAIQAHQADPRAPWPPDPLRLWRRRPVHGKEGVAMGIHEKGTPYP